jgi:hypothetical protein
MHDIRIDGNEFTVGPFSVRQNEYCPRCSKFGEVLRIKDTSTYDEMGACGSCFYNAINILFSIASATNVKKQWLELPSKTT